MLTWLSPKFWLELAIVVMLIATHGFAYKTGKATVRNAWDAEKLATSEASRQKEKALTIATTKVDNDLQLAKARRTADAVITSQRLRDYQTASASAPATTSCGTVDPYQSIAGECTAAIEKLDRYAQQLAGTVAGLQQYTREVCLKVGE